MTKKKTRLGKTSKKALKRMRKTIRPEKPAFRAAKPIKLNIERTHTQQAEIPVVEAESAKEGAGFKIVLSRIEGETIIGDLMVVFPRTREVLKKHGLNLDVEDAGDIYMSLEAFAALQGLEMEPLLVELETVSREPPPQTPVAAIVTTPAP